MTNIYKNLEALSWLKSGFIFQKSPQQYVLGQGPFTYSSRPRNLSLYRPNFFLTQSKPYVYPTAVHHFNKATLSQFLFKNSLHKISQFQNDIHLKQHDMYFKNCKLQARSFILYQKLFHQAQQSIRQGLFKKVVPRLSLNQALHHKFHHLGWLQKLFKNTSHMTHGFMYGFWDKDEGCLGYTPEQLFSLQDNNIYTMALAGTGLNVGPCLLNDPKELQEHLVVIDGLKQSLKGLVKLQIDKTVEIAFPPLKHLYTRCQGLRIKKNNFEQLCHQLHPTAALGGYPKNLALTWIKNHNSDQKNHDFGAPFGWYESYNKTSCLIALRGLSWYKHIINTTFGSGVIKESQLLNEWRELHLKHNQIKSFFK